MTWPPHRRITSRREWQLFGQRCHSNGLHSNINTNKHINAQFSFQRVYISVFDCWDLIKHKKGRLPEGEGQYNKGNIFISHLSYPFCVFKAKRAEQCLNNGMSKNCTSVSKLKHDPKHQKTTGVTTWASCYQHRPSLMCVLQGDLGCCSPVFFFHNPKLLQNIA